MTLIAWDEYDVVSTEPDDYIQWYHDGHDYRAFQRAALAQVLATLSDGQSIPHPVLHYDLHATHHIIFDAPLGRCHHETGQYIDNMIHIDIPLDVSLCRRLLRDFKNSSITKEDILKEIQFYLDHARPLFFDADLKESADLVVNGLLPPEQASETVRNYLSTTQYCT